MIDNDSLRSSFDETTSSQGCPPTDSEMGELFEKLSLTGTKPAILSLVAPYSDKYVPKSSLDVFPKPLNVFNNHRIFSCHTMSCWGYVKLFPLK